ncbi:fibronectin type 3 and ankyrin repeat domains protein 1-like isoform X2 [Dysidea avara]|uniref:fibronectin type 3 and ankyrin repeat domains protein 1-like isoform X2 n=1 Tax=Dysidea avara TaxID=196820 RepID=UPI00331A1775
MAAGPPAAGERKPSTKEKKKINTAACDGDLNTLQLLHKEGVDVTGVVNDANWTGLHFAAFFGHYNVASSLLDWGCEVDVVCVSQYACMASYVIKWTPLHYAASMGHTNVVTLLVGKGADVNMKDKDGRTPLENAVSENKSGPVDYFINTVGMDPTQYDQETQQDIKRLGII